MNFDEFREHIDELLESIYSKINDDEKLLINTTIKRLNDCCEKMDNAQRIYLKSLQKHNERNEKMDDTAVDMYIALGGE